MKEQILEAARATIIPEGWSGRWRVRRFGIADPMPVTRSAGRKVTIPPGIYTQLFRFTEATMHQVGELVMQDTPDELNTHLDFMLRAHGRVLVTGLGLGCVARGCLANPRVTHVTVLERDPHVMQLVGLEDWASDPRLAIIPTDAVQWCARNREPFDCAWHDLWSDPDKEEDNLQVTHARLICECINRVGFQGAWALPRRFRRQLRNRECAVL